MYLNLKVMLLNTYKNYTRTTTMNTLSFMYAFMIIAPLYAMDDLNSDDQRTSPPSPVVWEHLDNHIQEDAGEHEEVDVFEEIISDDFLPDKYLQEIQKEHLEIIKLNNMLERKIYDLGDSMEKVIKEKKVDLEDTKKILGWREVQDLIKDHYKRENVRKSWAWQGSWRSKFKRYIDGGTSSWFF